MHKHPFLKAIKIFIIIFAIVVFITAIHNHSITKQEEIASQNNIQNTRNMNTSSKKYTVNKVRTQLGNQAPNINDAEVNSNKRLKTGLSLAFSGKMNKKNIIQNNLGSMTGRVMQVTQGKGWATKTKIIDIGYGEYNIQTKAMPIHIIIKYMSGKKPLYVSYVVMFKPQASYKNQYSLLSYSGNAYN